jgi:hypothetical protein
MKIKPRVSVPVEKPKLLAVIAINIATALFTQSIFALLLLGLFQRIWHTAGLPQESYYSLMITAILTACGFTAAVVVITEFLIEKMPFFDAKRVLDREANRAMYFSVIGMVGVCATKAAEADRMLPVAILIVLIALLLVLGRYHEKFREARRGVWFPHTIFQYGLQQFVLFPAGLWIVGLFLNRAH